MNNLKVIFIPLFWGQILAQSTSYALPVCPFNTAYPETPETIIGDCINKKPEQIIYNRPYLCEKYQEISLNRGLTETELYESGLFNCFPDDINIKEDN